MNPLFLILAIVVGLIVCLIIYIIIRKILASNSNRKEIKKLKSDLLIRKQLSQIAKGGAKGVIAENDALRTRIEKIKNEFIFGLKNMKLHFSEDPINIPWYLVVGEPGAGKSELMRSSQLDFVSGLVDLDQGKEGTSTMHWWITKDAAFIDVAGRVFFQNWGKGKNNELSYLINLIENFRKNNPLNGIILTIPVDSLILDQETLLNEKVNQTIDALQKICEITKSYIPVYIMITKIDSLSGFQEFSNNLRQEEISSVLGYSVKQDEKKEITNSNINQFFKELYEKLDCYRRKNSIYFVTKEDYDENKIKKCSGLYLFAEEVLSLEKNIYKYVSKLVGRNLDKERLMFRGFFFCAAKIGSNIIAKKPKQQINGTTSTLLLEEKRDSLQGYFITQVFDSFILRESSLAHFSKFRHYLKQKKSIIATILLLLISVFFIISMFSNYNDILTQANNANILWRANLEYLNNGSIAKSPLISSAGGGNIRIDASKSFFGDTNITRIQYLKNLSDASNTYYPMPYIYALASIFSNSDNFFTLNLFDRGRIAAYESIYIRMIYKPLLEASREKMVSSSATSWNSSATKMLNFLLDSATLYRTNTRNSSSAKDFGIQTMLSYLDNKELSELLSFFPYVAPKSLKHININDTVYSIIDPLSSQTQNAIKIGIVNFCQYWKKANITANNKDLSLYNLYEINKNLKIFNDDRQTLYAIENNNKNDMTYHTLLEKRKKILDTLNEMQKSVDTISNMKKDMALTQTSAFSYITAADIEYKNYISSVFNPILEDMAAMGMNKQTSGLFNLYESVRQTKEEILGKENELISYLETDMTKNIGNNFIYNPKLKQCNYEITMSILSIPKSMIFSGLKINLVQGLADYTAQNSTLTVDAQQKIDSLKKDLGDDQSFKDDFIFSDYYKKIGIIVNRLWMIRKIFKFIPNSEFEMEKAVESSNSAFLPAAPFIPYSAFDGNFLYNSKFNPNFVIPFMRTLNQISKSLDISVMNYYGNEWESSDLSSKIRILNDYLAAYINYWGTYVFNETLPVGIDNWDSFINKVAQVNTYSVNDSLQHVYTFSMNSILDLEIVSNSMLTDLKDNAIKKYQTQLSLLQNIANYNEKCQTIISSWSTLPKITSDAYATIMKTPPSTSISQYFIQNTNGKVDKNNWFNNLVFTGINVLKHENLKETYALMKKISSNGKFPLVKNIYDPSFSNEEIKSLYADLSKNYAFAALPEKSTNYNSVILEEIYPYPSFSSSEEKAWWINTLEIINLLGQDNIPLSWSIIIPSRDFQLNPPTSLSKNNAAIPAAVEYRYFEITSDGNTVLGKQFSISPNANEINLNTTQTPVYTKNLEIKFYKALDSLNQSQVVSYKGSWSILRLMFQNVNNLVVKNNIYYLPLIFNDDLGNSCYYWIGITFSRPMPSFNSWPSSTNWWVL